VLSPKTLPKTFPVPSQRSKGRFRRNVNAAATHPNPLFCQQGLRGSLIRTKFCILIVDQMRGPRVYILPAKVYD
jgi:hypothetical protein